MVKEFIDIWLTRIGIFDLWYNEEKADLIEIPRHSELTLAPLHLGFFDVITESLTPAGEALIHSRRKDEVFLRQMLKFQIIGVR